MAFEIIVGRSLKPINYGAASVTISDNVTMQAVLKDNTSIVAPTFVIHNEAGEAGSASFLPSRMNYVHCPQFNRYYNIVDITWRTAVIIEISCQCDVLTSFYDEIMQSSGFIQYSCNAAKAALIADMRYPRCSDSDAEVFGPFYFPGMVQTLTGGTYIMGIASMGASMVDAYAFRNDDMVEIANKLYNVNPWAGLNMNHYYYNPDEALFYCRWVPFPWDNVKEEMRELSLNGVSLGTHPTAKRNEIYVENIPVVVEHKYHNDGPTYSSRDPRNIEPYCEWDLALPGVGLIQIPITEFGGDFSGTDCTIWIRAHYCYWTGDVSYYLCRNSTTTVPYHDIRLVATAHMGVDIPITHYSNTTSLINTVGSILGTMSNGNISNSLTHGLSPEGHGLIAAATLAQSTSQFAQSFQSIRTASGPLNGWATPSEFIGRAYLIRTNHRRTDENYYGSYGYPIMRWDLLSSHAHGYIQCGQVHLYGNRATADEQKTIIEYLTSGCYLNDTDVAPSLAG